MGQSAWRHRRQLSLPGAFGVFFYRSASIETLECLARFHPGPAAKLTAEFEVGFNAVQICARALLQCSNN